MALTRPRAAQIYNLDYKQATRVVTTTNVTLSGGAPSVVDGVTLSLGDRILVTGQTTASQNGLYDVTTVGSGNNGTWVRTSDGNQTGEIDAGMIVMVTEGVTYADTQWKLITDNPITIDTTPLTFNINILSSVGGANTQVQYNRGGTLAGSANLTFDGANVTALGNVTGGNILTTGLISATSTITSVANIAGGNITTAGQVSATANVTGGNLITGGIISASGNIATTGNITAGGHITNSTYISTNTLSAVGAVITGNITGGNILTAGIVSSTGNATHGNLITAGTLTVNSGNAVTAIVNGGGNGVGNIGSSTATFNTIFAKATTAQYADLAEMYCADDFYPPGTVVEFGGISEITITTTSHSTAVAGIISTNPSYLMNSTIACEVNALEVALVGRVPCQVVGTIRKGDRLVSSKIPGVAQAMNTALYEPGCIVGKALEDYNSSTPGIIEVAVGRI
jgi:hypothetical protein